ncbi:amino acid ABC transporter permease [Amphibacillus cookii]|uniref:amino acid ABC transporter permease n=1 Tax=Amphibacillus cookii TaxID=767787 RepID=UPI00195BF3B3|nr:amino acid ABC transporter permease [Amphibacillus cookii]MBM7540719.1 L-cystine transport system permease protein [Amphibacillus cookii]
MDQIIDLTFMGSAFPRIIEAIPTTLVLLCLSMLLGLVLGFILTVMKVKGNKAMVLLASTYISFMRGTPPIVQLFLIYYGSPNLLSYFGMNVDRWDKMIFAFIAFGLGNAAYLSEAMRSAYLSVPSLQLEAAQSVGMTDIQAFRRIILPQTLVVAVPNLTNSTVIVLKNTSLAFTIGMVDLVGQARMVSSAAFGAKNLEVYLIAALVYFVLCIFIEQFSQFLENYFKRKMGQLR